MRLWLVPPNPANLSFAVKKSGFIINKFSWNPISFFPSPINPGFPFFPMMFSVTVSTYHVALSDFEPDRLHACTTSSDKRRHACHAVLFLHWVSMVKIQTSRMLFTTNFATSFLLVRCNPSYDPVLVSSLPPLIHMQVILPVVSLHVGFIRRQPLLRSHNRSRLRRSNSP